MFVLRKYIKTFLPGLILLIGITISATAVNLLIPNWLSVEIDKYTQGNFVLYTAAGTLFGISILVFVLSIVQTYLSTLIGERFASLLRHKIVEQITKLSYTQIEDYGTEKIYTNFTSDVDKSKEVITTATISVLSAVLLLLGSSGLLVYLNWKLAIIALLSLPFIAVLFGVIFGRVSKFFRKAQENLDKINQVVLENINGAQLVRVLNSKKFENKKFDVVNTNARNISQTIVNSFATMIPIVNFLTNLVTILILYFGGQLVVNSELTLGGINAFLTYYALLIQPIFILGFVANIISSSFISLGRINTFLDIQADSNLQEDSTKLHDPINSIEFKAVNLEINSKKILDNINFVIKRGTKTALLGPVGAGKSQIFYLIIGLIKPTSGQILINGQPIEDWDKEYLKRSMGVVFQDSIIFNSTITKNICFDNPENPELFQKAVQTAQVAEFVDQLEGKFETIIDERGSNLSGGQKQRITLARSLFINPQILLLDDFTARVDINTERRILAELDKNYQGITLLSITQKIEPIKDYDNIIFLMEGELIAQGNHQELIKNSSDYQQILKSQDSLSDN
jgi:ATP-binding cassette, subfamily B, bacterial